MNMSETELAEAKKNIDCQASELIIVIPLT